MSKIAHYLNTHMVGEVITNPHVRAAYARDGSIVTMVPDMVAYPMVTNDIRKIARFSWELAEKGHALAITVRGSGTDKTGAAVGNGIVVAMTTHMHRIFEYDTKQKLVRLQPGVTISAFENALGLHGTAIPEFRWEHHQASVGGAIGSSRSASEYVDQLEVVLASGDVLQTKRLNKRELAKKKALPGFEGDIYRDLDALIDENKATIDDLQANDDRLEHHGYSGLELVKDRDGSFDLTPLFVGTQGTLGIISEMILKVEFVNQTPSTLVAVFGEADKARDAIDIIDAIQPTSAEYIDGVYLAAAARAGKTFPYVDEAVKEVGSVAAIIVVTINDFSARARSNKVKKLQKALKPHAANIVTNENESAGDLRALRSVTTWQLNPDQGDQAAPPLCDGIYIPLERFEDFAVAIEELAKRHHVSLPLYGRPLDELWYVRPMLRMSSVGDKQKALKLMKEIAQLARRHSGSVGGEVGEGRFHFIADTDEEQQELFKKVKTIFDPHGTLNPGVKQEADLRNIAKTIHSTYTAPAATDYLSKF